MRPLDHVVQFESECGFLRNNEKVMIQLPPSSLSGMPYTGLIANPSTSRLIGTS